MNGSEQTSSEGLVAVIGPSPHVVMSRPLRSDSTNLSITSAHLEISQTSVSESGQIVEPQPTRKEFEFPIEFLGVEFWLREEEGVHQIHHRKYSVFGYGSSVQEALRDLLLTIRSLRQRYANCEIAQLGPDAIDLRNFLLTEVRA